MNQFKSAQVIMLPTEKSNIVLIVPHIEYVIGTKENKPYLQGGKNWTYNKSITDDSEQPQHLYIISDDEIKENDWFIQTHPNIQTLVQCDKQNVQAIKNFQSNTLKAKKIIATTASVVKKLDDIYYGIGDTFNLPQPSQQFIEKYIESYNKGEIITDVLVEYEEDETCQYCCGSGTTHGKECHCVKLKINPKDNTITIKKLKDVFTFENMKSAFNAGMNCPIAGATFEEWIKIKENL